MMWTFRAEGRLFHSGLPHKGINSMELGMEAMAYIQAQFYKDFPPVGPSSLLALFLSPLSLSLFLSLSLSLPSILRRTATSS